MSMPCYNCCSACLSPHGRDGETCSGRERLGVARSIRKPDVTAATAQCCKYRMNTCVVGALFGSICNVCSLLRLEQLPCMRLSEKTAAFNRCASSPHAHIALPVAHAVVLVMADTQRDLTRRDAHLCLGGAASATAVS
ncbi:unnamed protein product [Ectocarpus sp. 13 AM-2016]